MPPKFYITTAIPYVNAKPHIGFALELVQADVMARYHRLHGDDVFYLNGSDDNSLKNVQAAEKAGKQTADFVAENSAIFENLSKRLAISNDGFIRTASPEHFKGAQKLWAACKPEDIYKKKYRGLYCVGCEEFYTEQQLVNGKCPDHGTVPDEVEEENYFFKLSNYQAKLEKLIESDEYRILPASRKNEALSFIRGGLQDFSISRSVERARGWGVPVPGDPSQIMYVWFDALSNYLTGIGYQDASEHFKTYWPADAHVIGKGVIRFHAIYWPAMLLSADVPLPRALFVHGYITIDGAKMSKSIGNVIDPFDLIERYGTEVVRWYLLRHIHPFEDSDFSEARFKELYNADLANGLGNLVSRVTNMIEKYCDGVATEASREAGHADSDSDLEKSLAVHLATWNFQAAMTEIWREIQACNQVIDETKPWELAKHDSARAQEVVRGLASRIRTIVQVLQPYMPATADAVRAIFSAERIVKSAPLFGRIEA